MMKKTCPILLVVLVAALLGALGCKHEEAAIGRLDVQPRTVTLAYPQLTSVHLTFAASAAPASAAALPADDSRTVVFLHLLDPQGVVVRTFDRSLHPAEDVRLYQSALAPPLDPGRYRLTVGLYDRNTGKRSAVSGLGEPVGRDEYMAATVEVPPTAAGPRFAFSDAWEPIEAGTDKQVVARRWLSDQPGEIRIDGMAGAGSLWLRFRIPQGTETGEKLVLNDPTANTPEAVVRGNCAAVETGISGPGPHAVEIPVDAATAQKGCQISLTPNFHLVSPNRKTARSVALEVAAWVPAAARATALGSDGTEKTEP
jgi:hypothetical protein